jgi:hypothetical protein
VNFSNLTFSSRRDGINVVQNNQEVAMEGRKNFEVPTGDVLENPRDEAIILADQDQTESGDPQAHDENLGQDAQSANNLEEEPAEFVRGEVDVVEQMKRTSRAMDHIIHGHGQGGTRT